MPNRPECLGPIHYLIDYETILDRFLLETRLADGGREVEERRRPKEYSSTKWTSSTTWQNDYVRRKPRA